MTVDGNTVQTHIVRADGRGDRILPSPGGALWQAPESWSNDGSKVLIVRGYTGGGEQARPAAVPVSRDAFGVEIPYPGGMSATET